MAVVRKLEAVSQDEPTGPTEAQILAVINAAVSILGARLLLLVGLVGAIALSYLAVLAPSATSIIAQGVFGLFIFAPLIWLSARRSV